MQTNVNVNLVSDICLAGNISPKTDCNGETIALTHVTFRSLKT